MKLLPLALLTLFGAAGQDAPRRHAETIAASKHEYRIRMGGRLCGGRIDNARSRR